MTDDELKALVASRNKAFRALAKNKRFRQIAGNATTRYAWVVLFRPTRLIVTEINLLQTKKFVVLEINRGLSPVFIKERKA